MFGRQKLKQEIVWLKSQLKTSDKVYERIYADYKKIVEENEMLKKTIQDLKNGVVNELLD